MIKEVKSQDVNRISCLIIGSSGIGKTSLLKTILGQDFDIQKNKWTGEYNHEKVYVLSAESGLLSVKNLINENIIKAYEINTLKDILEVYNLLSTDEFINNISKGGSKWIFIDSLTEIADLCESMLKEKYKDKSDNWGLWSDYSDIMTNIIRKFRSLSQYNVVFTCLDVIDKDQNNCRYYAPDVNGKKFPRKLVSLFDEVFYMIKTPDKTGTEHVAINTGFSTLYPAKDRSGDLDVIEKPNLLAIKNKIVGNQSLPDHLLEN